MKIGIIVSLIFTTTVSSACFGQMIGPDSSSPTDVKSTIGSSSDDNNFNPDISGREDNKINGRLDDENDDSATIHRQDNNEETDENDNEDVDENNVTP